MLWLSFSGQLSIYLHPSLQPYTTAAGVVFLLLAIFGFRSVFLISTQTHHACGCDHHGHDPDETESQEHHHHDSSGGVGAMIFKTILLLLPLAIIVSGKATAYSITTVQNRGVVDNINNLPSAKAGAAAASTSASKGVALAVPASSPVTSSSTPSPQTSSSTDSSSSSSSGGPMPLQVIDMLYAVQMPSYRGEFEGKDVELVGRLGEQQRLAHLDPKRLGGEVVVELTTVDADAALAGPQEDACGRGLAPAGTVILDD